MKVLTFNSLNSTNAYAKQLALDKKIPKEDTIIIADKQTAGKGQFGRDWYSKSLGGLYYTFLHFPQESLNLTQHFTLKVGKITAMVLKEAITQKNACLDVDVEWPNDLIVNQKKIGGILVERKQSATETSYLIVGIGLNLNQRAFPEPLKPIATSVYLETGKRLDKQTIIKRLTNEIYNLLMPEGQSGYLLT